ncbi:HAD family hydrolase [Streptantibioticus cattleyicolor]|uniref:Uncharacterized protein n=1 Tax=Streptantibioticus cattleyicolor TaxID=29303 RepID=Q83XP6_STRCT|nr:HAD family phosphatase [Streptantibioticus cattleyicolor]CAD18976.1 hypothetical protein [Streptantibioticus cattleyicolor]CCB71853.1 Hydrolase [Streptantibioticus cattleyicolor NRRL 8057 = DSM 46488]
MVCAASSPAGALLVDWGGVLTQPFYAGIAEWAARDGVDADAFHALLARHLGPGAPGGAAASVFHRVERGEVPVAELEVTLAESLRRPDGTGPPAEGLIQRMFQPFTMAGAMVELVRRVRASGAAVALLSNSWGHTYDRTGWDGLFDEVVISCEVGMRKPEPEIYRYTARRLGVAPRRCVFLDDLGRNVRAAAAVGMTAVQHTSVEESSRELARFFDVSPLPAGR